MSFDTEVSGTRLWLVLAKAHGSIASYIEQSIAGYGLCLSKFMVLEVLLHKGPLTISTIGEKVLLASASMTSAIDGLEKLGLVIRKRSKEDRRVRLVALTPKGRELIMKLFAQHVKDLDFIMRDIAAEERGTVRSALKKMGLAARAALSQQDERFDHQQVLNGAGIRRQPEQNRH